MVADSWRILGLQSIGSNWVYTPVVEGCFFRFSFLPPFRAYQLLVAQCQLTGAKLEIFDIRTIYPRSELEILQFEPPPFFDNRRIGIRGIAGQKALLKIEVNQMPVYSDPINPVATGATTTTAPASTTSTTILAANSSRKALTIYNNSTTAILYISFGTTVSSTNFAEKIPANSRWEMPIDYVGAIVGVWSVANGNALLTEFV